MLELEHIKKNYKDYNDTRIELIAWDDSKSLRENVVPILKGEIKKRGLNEFLIDWINAERRDLTKEDLIYYRGIVKNGECSFCKVRRNLKGYKYTTQIGVLIRNIRINHKIICCESCGIKKRRLSNILTLTLGWWSLGGILTTPFVLIDKFKLLLIEDKQNDQVIVDFINLNIGIITISNDNEKLISDLIGELNYLNN